MELNIQQLNSTKYNLHFEPKDELYHSCMWATIILDHDSYTMYATTDCGNYTHSWRPTPDTESFLKLMCRIGKEYLLGKISEQTVVNLDESKKKTLGNIKRFCRHSLTAKELKDLCDEINDIDVYGEESFFLKANDIMEDYKLRDTFELIDCVTEYPAGARTFARIFCEVLQPQLRKQLAEKTTEKSA